MFVIGQALYVILLILALAGPVVTFFAVYHRKFDRALVFYGGLALWWAMLFAVEAIVSADASPQLLYGLGSSLIAPMVILGSQALSVVVGLVCIFCEGNDVVQWADWRKKVGGTAWTTI